MSIKIQLEVNGKNETFSAAPKKARIVRNAAELLESFGADLKVDELDSIAKFISEVFDDQFSTDNVFDGIDSDKLVPKFYEIVNALLGKVSEKTSQFPNAETAK